jgi:hypothetical protein
MSSLVDEAGLPPVEPGTVKITPQPRGGVMVEIGRERRTKRLWLSAEEETRLRDALVARAPRRARGRQS